MESDSTSKMQFHIVSDGEFKFITYIISSYSCSYQTRRIFRKQFVQYQHLPLIKFDRAVPPNLKIGTK